jgi:hypothetical protein
VRVAVLAGVVAVALVLTGRRPVVVDRGQSGKHRRTLVVP